jgi:hypothetical protein
MIDHLPHIGRDKVKFESPDSIVHFVVRGTSALAFSETEE